MTVYEKLNTARVKLQEKKLKKSGFNSYSKFSYFELSDFLPSINQIFNEEKLTSQFSFELIEGVEHATLTIINAEKAEETIKFTTPIAEAGMKGATPIQQLGAVHTYLRRYLWLMAMEICEHDAIDATSGKQSKKVVETATEEQIKQLRKLYTGNNLFNLLNANGIQELKELPKTKADELLKKIEQMKGASSNPLENTAETF